MTLRRNLALNYASQMYSVAVGLIVVPVYLRTLGAEAYGLVAFYSMLQAWFVVLDLGLTPAIARETSRYFAGVSDAGRFGRIFAAIELVVLLIAAGGGAILILSSNAVATSWLELGTHSQHDVAFVLQLMGVAIVLRWATGCYRGVLIGAEKFLWIAPFSVTTASLRSISVIPTMILFGATAKIFFIHQVFVALVEFVGLRWMARRLMPAKEKGFRLEDVWREAIPTAKFAMTIGFTSTLWIVVTQSDKLILSKLLTLADYGYFSIAVLMAGGLMTVSAPISGVLMPRLASLEAARMDGELKSLYLRSTAIAVALVSPLVTLFAFFPDYVLLAWLGDENIAAAIGQTLRLYSIGYGLIVVSAFPYYLQFAKGDMRRHAVASTLFLIALVPGVIVVTGRFGMVGAGWVWLAVCALYFVAVPAWVHSRMLPGIQARWMTQAILPSVVCCSLASIAIRSSSFLDGVGIELLLKLAAVSGVLLGVSYLAGAVTGLSRER